MSDWLGISRVRLKPEIEHSLTEWEDVNQPLSRCKTTLDSIHGFVRAEEYRMIWGVYRKSIRNLQGKCV